MKYAKTQMFSYSFSPLHLRKVIFELFPLSFSMKLRKVIRALSLNNFQQM